MGGIRSISLLDPAAPYPPVVTILLAPGNLSEERERPDGRQSPSLHSQRCRMGLQRLLADNGITCSMSRAGNVWDNSAMERIFSTPKIKRTFRKVYRTRNQAVPIL